VAEVPVWPRCWCSTLVIIGGGNIESKEAIDNKLMGILAKLWKTTTKTILRRHYPTWEGISWFNHTRLRSLYHSREMVQAL